MTLSLKFWYYFSITGILLFIASVVLTFLSFVTNSQELIKSGFILALTLIGIFMMYFGIWRGDKVVQLRHTTTIGDKKNDNQ